VSFKQTILPDVQYAIGYRDDGITPVQGACHLAFPPLAAGGMGSPRALARILLNLALAYKCGHVKNKISHKTSRLMLDNGVDKGALEFMGSLIGYGVFILEARNNRFLLHQAANDGFRGITLICFDGPAASQGPIGFVILCNGDNNGTSLLAEVSKFILKNNKFGIKDGVDWTKVEHKNFEHNEVSQEEIVNKGFKELLLDAFLPKAERYPN
jgi:hypothetical protein